MSIRKIKDRNKRRADESLMGDSMFSDSQFIWGVSPTGYSWFDVPGGDSPRLIPFGAKKLRGREAWSGFEEREYQPLVQRRGLFLEFAETERTPDGFKAFADQWGFLLHDAQLYGRRSGNPPSSTNGESLFLWRHTVLQMNRAVKLWELVKHQEVAALQTLFTKDEKWQRWLYDDGVRGEEESDATVSYSDVPASGGIVEVAQTMIAAWINLGMQGHCDACLAWSETTKRYEVRVFPSSLLAAMWWQFARAFTGETDYPRCLVCRMPMEVGKGAFRGDREICSPACRQKAHREKVREVRVLHASGSSVVRLAKRYKTTEDTIQNWLSKEK